jgi:hypothetical protein
MSTFLNRYVDSLVGAPDECIPGRARDGYSFGERYWASLTRSTLPPKTSHPGHGAAEPSRTGTVAQLAPRAVLDQEDYPEPHREMTATRHTGGARHRVRPRPESYKKAARLGWALGGLIGCLSVAFVARLIPFTAYLIPVFLLLTAIIVISIGNSGPGKSLRVAISGATVAIALAVALSTGLVISLKNGLAPEIQVGLGGGNIQKASSSIEFARIRVPRNGAPGIPGGKDLQVSGIAGGIPPGHHLWLIATSDPATQFWIGSDVTVRNGNWTGTVYIPRGKITLALIDLGPAASKELREYVGGRPGVLTLPILPALVTLDKIWFGTAPSPSSGNIP